MAVPIPQISNYVDLGEQLRQKWERERQQKLQDEQNSWARQDRALKLQKIAQEEMARKKFQQAIQPSPLAPFTIVSVNWYRLLKAFAVSSIIWAVFVSPLACASYALFISKLEVSRSFCF